MPVYMIAQLTIHNRELFDEYLSGLFGIWGRFRGRVLAADDDPVVVEGHWDGNRAVLLEFPDEAAFREWYDSADYQKIVKLRHASANGTLLLAKGYPEDP